LEIVKIKNRKMENVVTKIESLIGFYGQIDSKNLYPIKIFDLGKFVWYNHFYFIPINEFGEFTVIDKNYNNTGLALCVSSNGNSLLCIIKNHVV
jgi:hypothetical protein